MSSNNPYQAPTTVPENQKRKPKQGYGGIGRLAYFLMSLGVAVVQGTGMFVGEENHIQGLALAAVVLGLIANLALATLRIKNLGYRGLWVLGLFVPVLNILVQAWCVAAPEGYADHKTLDTAGKIIVGIFLGLIALVVLAVVLGV